MKRNRTYQSPDDAAILAGVFGLAVSISIESRRIVQHELSDVIIEELPPHVYWLDLLRERDRAGHRDALHAAATSLVKWASPTMRPYVASAARRLVEAIGDLAAWCPEHELRPVQVVPCRLTRRLGFPDGWTSLNWTPTEESLARLDDLRHRVWSEYVGVEELLRDHTDAASRVLCVAKRIAEFVLEPADARLVTGWLTKLEAGDRAAA